MKSIIVTVVFLLSNFILAQEAAIQKDVKEALKIAKETSLYRANVNWTVLEKAVLEKAKYAKTHLDLKPALDYLLASLMDHHGMYIYDHNLIGNYKNPNEMKTEHTPEFLENVKFRAELLEGHIGYVRMRHLPMGDNVEMAKEIRFKVDSLIKKGANLWIVDLRYNLGGNMYPMLEGLAPILGNGNLGGTVNKDEMIDAQWEIKEGHFYYNNIQMVPLNNETFEDQNYNVAVLISNHTASSGEVVATAFHGRRNTKFFGEHTRGMITNNAWQVISDKFISNIATGYFTDRNGTVFKEFIHPNEIIEFKVENDRSKDEAVVKASTWLKGL